MIGGQVKHAIPKMPTNLRSCVRWAAKDPRDMEFDTSEKGAKAFDEECQRLVERQKEDNDMGFNTSIENYDFGWCRVVYLPPTNHHYPIRLWQMTGWPTKDQVRTVLKDYAGWFYFSRVAKILERIGEPLVK